MKKITRIVLAALLVACTVFTFAAFAEDEGRVITVTLDGNPIAFDVPPQLIEGRTMVPLRMIFEALGAEVSWDDATQTASGVKGDTTVKITINEKVLYKNGRQSRSMFRRSWSMTARSFRLVPFPKALK